MIYNYITVIMTSINYQIYKDSITIQTDIFTNIVKMLQDRKWLLKENISSATETLLKNKNDEGIYTIKLDTDLLKVDVYEANDDKKKWKNFNGKTVAVLLIHQKISGKTPTINDFLTKYSNMHKIIVTESITEKGKQTIMMQTNDKFTEIFTEEEFMLNLFGHILSPAYEVLTNEEAEKVKKEWKMSKRQTPKLFETDKASRHLYIKKGQVVRIIQNSEMTGESIYYRLVIRHGSTAI
jgi:DNA-directed RNA polymerase subunit H (RpoH/RPB5)